MIFLVKNLFFHKMLIISNLCGPARPNSLTVKNLGDLAFGVLVRCQA